MTRTLTRQQVLSWRETWSYTDKELIAHALDVLDDVDYYVVASETYVVARMDGRVAVEIAPGYLYWRAARFVSLVDEAKFPGGIRGDAASGWWYTLSTFQPRAGSTPTFEELRDTCPVCWAELPVTGECNCW